MRHDTLPPVVPREVTDGVHLLEVGWPEPIGANAYLVTDGDATLVDAGMPVGRRSLVSELAAVGYGPGDLDRVLLTHYDVDHVGGLRAIPAAVPVYLGAADVDLVAGSWSPPLDHPKGAYHRVLRRLMSLTERDVSPVADGDAVGAFRAIHTPGHNPGHTVFLHEDRGTALLGDLVRETDGRFAPPPWLDSYDTDRVAGSIDRVADESFEHACVGHGRPLGPGADAVLRDLSADL